MKRFIVVCICLIFSLSVSAKAQDDEAALENAIADFEAKKSEIVTNVKNVYLRRIAALEAKGEVVKAGELKRDLDNFLRAENPSQKLEINDAIRELKQRLVTLRDFDTSVQESKLKEEIYKWLDRNLKKNTTRLVFTIDDVTESQQRRGHFDVYLGHCESELGGQIQLGMPEYAVVKMTPTEAEKIGSKHRLEVRGTIEVGYFNRDARIDEQTIVFYSGALSSGVGDNEAKSDGKAARGGERFLDDYRTPKVTIYLKNPKPRIFQLE